MVNIMIDTEQLKGVAGRYWRRLDDGRIQCDVCPRFSHGPGDGLP
jgi:pyruvate formate lyase activating enzyme